MPAENIEASACTRQTGSSGVNQRGPSDCQMTTAFSWASWPATRERSAPASWVRARASAGLMRLTLLTNGDERWQVPPAPVSSTRPPPSGLAGADAKPGP